MPINYVVSILDTTNEVADKKDKSAFNFLP